MKSLKGLLILTLIFSFFACKTKKDVVVSVGQDVVTTGDFKDKMQEAAYYYNRDYVETPQGKEQILDGIVKETVMLSAARDNGFDKTPEFKAQLNNFVRQALITSLVKDLRAKDLNITQEEIQAAYDANKAYYDNPIELKVAHILTLNKSDAEQVLADLNSGGDFPAIAKEKSIDQSSAANGGELNWFSKGDMVKDFENAAFSLKNKGDFSPIISTPFGYHIIKLIDSRKIDPITFDAVQTKLRRILEKEKFDLWYDSIKKGKSIKINKDKLADIKLD